MSDTRPEARFEQDLRSVLQALAPSDAPPSVREFVANVARRDAFARRRRPLFWRLSALTATVALAVVAGALLVMSINAPTLPAGTPAPSPSVSPTMPMQGTHRALEFRVTPADHSPTVADLQAVANVLLDRLAIYEPAATPGSASFTGEGATAVTISFDVPTDDPGFLDRVASALAAPGEVRFVPIADINMQPGQAIDPGLPSLLSGDAVQSASLTTDQTGNPALDIKLSPTATTTFSTWSASHVGTQFAVTLDGRIEFAPTLTAPITHGEILLVGGSSEPDAMERLAAVLQSGPLPYPVVLEPQPASS